MSVILGLIMSRIELCQGGVVGRVGYLSNESWVGCRFLMTSWLFA